MTSSQTSLALSLPFSLFSAINPQYHPSSHQVSINLKAIPPITITSIPALLLPYLLLYAQAYLLLRDRREDRWWRLALWPMAVASLLNAWFGYRWQDPYMDVVNFMYGCSAVYFFVKSTEWAFRQHPPRRINHPTTPSNLVFNAFHLCCSTRMVGWKDGMPLARVHPRRKKQLAHHLKMFLVHYLALDFCCWFCRTAFPDSIGSVSGGDIYDSGGQVIETFARWIPALETKLLHDPLLHLFAVISSYFVGWAVYQALCYGYHLTAVLGMLVLGEGGEEWPRLMNKPWRATSLLDFWGRRWHSIFKQAFIAPTLLIPRRHSRLRSLLLPLSAFAISGIMHELGAITFSGETSPNLRVSRFFLLLSTAATSEVVYHRLTGKRVGGIFGFIWCWTWLGVAGTPLARTWLQWGLGGQRIIPDALSLMACLDRRGLNAWLEGRFRRALEQ